MKSILTLLLLNLFSIFAFSATIKGKITDNKGEPLPFAIVFLKGTTLGTSANADGEFLLTVPDGNYTLVCQYMGFKQNNFPLKLSGNETITHNCALEEETLEMKEYVVKSTDDPALFIMRKVIARRTFHLNQIQTFQTDIYAKGIFRTRDIPKKIMGEKIDGGEMGLDSNGKGILNQFEENATYYSQDGKEKTVIHSVRESGDPNGLGMSQFPEVINLYKNNIEVSSRIAPRGMISPVSDGALSYYRYKLDGDFKEGNHTIYKISVTPKRDFEPLFTGVLYIVDDEWGIHSAHLSATKKANIEFIDTITLSQSYIPLKKDEWVIKQQKIFVAVKLLGFDIVGNLITVYNEQQINKKITDTVFSKKIVSEYDKGANKKDSAYWTETRPIPLDIEEIQDYIKKDSLRLIYEDPKRIDSLRRRSNRLTPGELILSGYGYRGKKDRFYVQTNSLLSGLVNYNTVEGWNTAPKISSRIRIDSSSYLTAVTAVRYGFNNDHFNGMGRINYVKSDRKWLSRSWLVGIEGGKYVFQYNPFNPIQPLYNSISTLFYRKNYLKIYERWNGTLFLGRNFGNGLKLNGQLGFQERIPLENTTDFSYAKSKTGGFTDNMPGEFKKYTWERHNAVIAKISASYQPGYTYTKYPDYLMPHGSRMPTFTLSYEKGIPGLFDSKPDFDKWRLGVRDDIDLNLLGNFSYNVLAGGFFNTKYVSIPDLNHLQGNQLGVATSYLESFQLAPYYIYSNKEPLFGEVHIEWQLRGFLTNKIPLFRKLAWYLVTGGNGYYANDNLYHVEAFVGLDNLGYSAYRFFRLDYVHAWNGFNQYTSAIRLGISTNSLVRINLGENTDTEW